MQFQDKEVLEVFPCLGGFNVFNLMTYRGFVENPTPPFHEKVGGEPASYSATCDMLLIRSVSGSQQL